MRIRLGWPRSNAGPGVITNQDLLCNPYRILWKRVCLYLITRWNVCALAISMHAIVKEIIQFQTQPQTQCPGISALKYRNVRISILNRKRDTLPVGYSRKQWQRVHGHHRKTFWRCPKSFTISIFNQLVFLITYPGYVQSVYESTMLLVRCGMHGKMVDSILFCKRTYGSEAC